MNCLEFRRLSLIDPEDEDVGRQLHADGCPECAAFAQDLLRQNELIREATEVEVPDGFAARILLNQSLQLQSRRPTRAVWLSLAASILLAVALIPAIVDQVFYQPFEEELVAHLGYHDVLKHSGSTPADPAKIAEVLTVANTAMPTSTENIIYASTCVIDGVKMAHLLVKNGDDEYVLMLLPEEHFSARTFQYANWFGKSASVNGRELLVIDRHGLSLDRAAEAFSSQFSEPLGIGQTI